MKRQTMHPKRMLLLVLLAQTACGSRWQPVTLVQPNPLDQKAVLEFHAKNQLVRLHGVEFKGDSLSGIPWLEHLSCDTCRVRYAVAEVSQARIGNPGTGAWSLVIPVVAVLSFLGLFKILLCGGLGGTCT